MYNHRCNNRFKNSWLLIGCWSVLLVGVAGCKQFNPKSVTQGQDASNTPVTKGKDAGEAASVDPGGITNVGQTCYVNATMQVMAAFYPNMFDPDRLRDKKNQKLAEEGRKVIQTINEGTTVNKDQANTFFEALKDVHNTPTRKKNTKEKIQDDCIQLGKPGDAYEILTTIFDALEFSQANSTVRKTHSGKKKIVFGEKRDPWNILKVDIRAKDEHAETPEFPSEIDMQFLAEYFRPSLVKDFCWEEDETSEWIELNQVPLLGHLSNLTNGILPLYIKKYRPATVSGIIAGKSLDTKALKAFSLTIKKEYLYEGANDVAYNLRGFISHSGSEIEGHYVAWIYRKDRNQWYYISDSYVEKKTVFEAEQAAEDADIFFYQCR